MPARSEECRLCCLASLPDVAAQIRHAARREMAETLEDVVFRRTGLGTLGHPGADAIARAADIMREEKGWMQAATLAEIDAVERRFKAAHAKAVA